MNLYLVGKINSTRARPTPSFGKNEALKALSGVPTFNIILVGNSGKVFKS